MRLNISDFNLISNLINSIHVPIIILHDSRIQGVNKDALDIFKLSNNTDLLLKPENNFIVTSLDSIKTRQDQLFVLELQLIDLQKHTFNKTAFIFNNDNFTFLVFQNQLLNNISKFESIYQFMYFLLDLATDMVLIFDPKTGQILGANQLASSFYGYSKKQLLSMKIQDIDNTDETFVIKQIEQSKSNQNRYFLFKHRLANASIHDVEAYNYPIKWDNETLIISIVYDISQTNKNEVIFSSLFNDVKDAVVFINHNAEITNINKHFSKLFGYTIDDIKGNLLTDFLVPKSEYNKYKKQLYRLFTGKIITNIGFRQRKNGQSIPVEAIAYPVISNKFIIGANIVYHDISAKIAVDNELKMLRKVLENNIDGVCIINKDVKVVWTNQAFTKIFEYTKEELIGKDVRILISEHENKEELKKIFDNVSETGSWSGEYNNITKSGKIFVTWLTLFTIKDSDNNIINYVTILRDITSLKENEKKISMLSKFDPLTGFYNQSYFQVLIKDVIQKSQTHRKKFALLSLIIENYEQVKYTIGFDVGEQYLTYIAKKLKDLLPKNKIISRYQVDEFNVILQNIETQQTVEDAVNKLQQVNLQTIKIQGNYIIVNLHIGISIYPDNSELDHFLIQYANLALQTSRSTIDKKYLFFQPFMKENYDKYYKIVNTYSSALKNNEFYLVYQPIIDVETNDIIGFEALIRWETKKGELIFPDEFIPILESTGDIYLLGNWIINQVCIQINKWKSYGIHIPPISINLSLKQIENVNFKDDLEAIILSNHIQSNEINFEVTESIYSGNWAILTSNFNYLKEKDFFISLDDFGTGYSSLSQIQKINIQRIKIDKSFIQDLENSKTEILVDAIIKMAHALRIKIVAEGVETIEQLTKLKSMHCDYIQGYYFYKPLETLVIEDLLTPLENTFTNRVKAKIK